MRNAYFLRVACLVVLASALAGFGPPVAAEVTRCTDAAGKVSYTDKACPSNTRRSEQLEIDTNGTTYPAAPAPAPARAPAPASAPEVVAQPPADGGLIVIDPRARDVAESRLQERERQRREAAERDAAGAYPYPYPYPYSGYPSAQQRRAGRPQDLRPTLRNCDAGGCNDTMGNHYDRAGKVDRYVRPDGRTCRPVGTTVVC